MSTLKVWNNLHILTMWFKDFEKYGGLQEYYFIMRAQLFKEVSENNIEMCKRAINMNLTKSNKYFETLLTIHLIKMKHDLHYIEYFTKYSASFLNLARDEKSKENRKL